MRFAIATACLASLVIAGCSHQVTDSAGDLVGTAENAIVNGTPDTTHQAVVAILSQSGNTGTECSGTVVQVTGSNGYVLTAAHCCTAQFPPQVVIFANDYAQATAAQTHNVIAGSIKQDPAWDMSNDTHDFCMLQFAGASGSTPVIPVLVDKSAVVAGTTTDLVGYGILGYANNNPNSPIQNSVRMHKIGPVDTVDMLTLTYNQASSGAHAFSGGQCEGDSGGPSLVTIGGKQYVAGVTSAGDQTCTQFGISGLVSSASNSGGFIDQYLKGQPITGGMDCNTCYTDAVTAGGACLNAVTACQNDTSCKALLTCLQACAAGDTACDMACGTSNQAGIAKYQAINSCVCTTACASSCGTDPNTCAAPTKCGLSASNATCQTCFEASCCAEAQACSNDSSCTACLVASPPASCGSNQNLTKLDSCLVSHCNTECGGSSSTSSSSSGSVTTSSHAASSSAGVGAGSTTGSGVGAGGPSGSGAGAGVATGAGGSGAGSAGMSGGCSVSTEDAGSSSGGALAGLGIAALVFARRRRVEPGA